MNFGNEIRPIVVNMPEGQTQVTVLQGQAPAQLDQLPPNRINLSGTIDAPLEFLRKRVGDINQHKAHIVVCRDELSVSLVYNEDDAYTCGVVCGRFRLSKVFESFGINNKDVRWEPEDLGQFLKMNRALFVSREENMKVVAALKAFDAKVNQVVQREKQENGNKASTFRQAVESNIPESFKLLIPVVAGDEPLEISVETFTTIDGSEVGIHLISPGANEVVEDVRNGYMSHIVDKLREVAPEIVIIEQ